MYSEDSAVLHRVLRNDVAGLRRFEPGEIPVPRRRVNPDRDSAARPESDGVGRECTERGNKARGWIGNIVQQNRPLIIGRGSVSVSGKCP